MLHQFCFNFVNISKILKSGFENRFAIFFKMKLHFEAEMCPCRAHFGRPAREKNFRARNLNSSRGGMPEMCPCRAHFYSNSNRILSNSSEFEVLEMYPCRAHFDLEIWSCRPDFEVSKSRSRRPRFRGKIEICPVGALKILLNLKITYVLFLSHFYPLNPKNNVPEHFVVFDLKNRQITLLEITSCRGDFENPRNRGRVDLDFASRNVSV